MQEKIKPKGPSNKEVNAQLLQEEEQSGAKKPKAQKNGWGKKKWNSKECFLEIRV